MSKKFRSASAQENLTKMAPWMTSWGQKPQLPLDHDVTLYPRVSTPKQLGNVSSEMQREEDGKLLQLALRCGWKTDQIRHPKDDMALSGRIKMEDRPAFKKMLQDIVLGEVKAVIAVEVDRLFRDKWGTEYSKFMEICEKYGVLVICPDMVYDFHDQYAVKRFRDRCVAAWEYLEYQIYGKMIGAKEFLGKTCRYVGGCTPVGYIADQREKLSKGVPNPNYRKYVIYKPHAEVVLRIFKRLRELNGRRWQLYRELVEQPFIFPDVEDWVEAEGFLFKTGLKKVPGGYRIGINGLCQLLANVVYIGYWIFSNMLISTASHDPIIPYEQQNDLFWFAFNKISSLNPDGTPNENYTGEKGSPKFTQPGHMVNDAMLKYIVEAADPKYNINVQAKYTKSGERTDIYFYVFNTSLKHATIRLPKYMLATKDVDGMFWKMLIKHLERAKDFDAYALTETDNRADVEARRKEIQSQIDACERAMKKLMQRIIKLEELQEEEAQDNNKDDEEEDEFLKEIRKEYKRFSAEKKRQEERLNKLNVETPNYASQMVTYRDLILEIRDKLNEYTTTEERQEIVDIFATKVLLDSVSPRVYSMEIHWRDTTWGVDKLVVGRQGNPSHWWTPENDELLKKHYYTATRRELTSLFPDRPLRAIYIRAAALGLKKTVEDRTSGKLDFPEDLSLIDREVMERFGLCWECCKARMATTNIQECSLHGGANGGEHGVYFVCYSGRYGSFTASGGG